MKTYIVALLLVAALPLAAQDFVFDKAYVRCENKWVILPKKPVDTAYTAAYLYLDREAGFSLRLQGKVSKSKNGRWHYTPFDKKSATIYRIPHDFEPIAALPDDIRASAGMPEIPDWVWDYREGEEDAAQLVQRGYHYNHAGASELALPLLIKAYNQEPDAGNLGFELSYAYNATHKYEEALKVLEIALKNSPNDPMLLREMGYSYAQMLRLAEAEAAYNKGIKYSQVPDQQAEMAFNMMGAFYGAKNKKKFMEWSDILKRYAAPDSVFLRYYLAMEKELDKN